MDNTFQWYFFLIYCRTATLFYWEFLVGLFLYGETGPKYSNMLSTASQLKKRAGLFQRWGGGMGNSLIMAVLSVCSLRFLYIFNRNYFLEFIFPCKIALCWLVPYIDQIWEQLSYLLKISIYSSMVQDFTVLFYKIVNQ